MASVGEESRLNSVFGSSGAVIFAIDHNFNPETGQSGTPDIPDRLSMANVCGVDAVLAHQDVFDDPENQDIQTAGMNTILQVNALDKYGSRVMVDTADQVIVNAVRIDAKMLGIQIDFGSESETQSRHDLNDIAERATKLGMPILVHTYLRNGEDTFEGLSSEEYGDKLVAAISTVKSLGGHVVKIAYRDPETFQRGVNAAHGLDLRIVMAGGSRVPTAKVLANSITAMLLDADGITVGRNAFDRPWGNTEPLLDIPSFGPVPVSLGGIDVPTEYFKVPDDELTVLLALVDVVHNKRRRVSDSLQEALFRRDRMG
jgi:DhnA family fructose-bisphosphate aldolase class Ia